jgi:hypothetical protein
MRENFRTRKLALRAFVCSSEREREREKKRSEEDAPPPAKSVRFAVLPCFLLLDSFEYLLKREEEQSLGVREIHQHDRRSPKRTTRGRGEECD